MITFLAVTGAIFWGACAVIGFGAIIYAIRH
jgi:thiamine transporter ThiT